MTQGHPRRFDSASKQLFGLGWGRFRFVPMLWENERITRGEIMRTTIWLGIVLCAVGAQAQELPVRQVILY